MRALALACLLGTSIPDAIVGQAVVLRRFEGHSTDAQFGRAVAHVGDVDGDGRSDFAIGTPDSDSVAQNAGTVIIVSGGTGTVLFTWDGLAAVDQYGWSVAGAGDTNGDGHADVIIGAIGTDTNAVNCGSFEVRSGLDGAILLSASGTGPFETLGWDVSGAGDIDDDGFDDVLVAAPGDSTAGLDAGRVAVWSVRNGVKIHEWFGTEPFARFGHCVAGVGNVDDGLVPDIAVGQPFADDGLFVDVGKAHLFAGEDGATLRTVTGTSLEGYLGWSVDGCGDVDQDGRDDWIFGAPYHRVGLSPRGLVRIMSGDSPTAVQSWIGATTLERLGWSVAGGGDIDGDGVPDALVGAPGADSSGAGSDFGLVLAVSGADASVIFSASGESPGDEYGDRVALGGDTNTNGHAECLVASRLFDVGAFSDNAGRVDLLEVANPSPNQARFSLFGAGCVAGSGRLPRIGLDLDPVIGTTPTVTLRAAPPGASALMSIESSTTPIDLSAIGAAGCVLRTPSAIGISLGVDPAGRLDVPLSIPNNPSLIGSRVYLQWILVESVLPFGFSALVSDAAELVLGL